VSELRQAPVISPLARRARLSDHIVETLSRLIVEGELEPGTVIRTEELARQLGVSRTPMREALQRLEADGFVTVAPNGITKVVKLEVDEALELMDIREVVDGLAASLLAERGTTPAVYNELTNLVANMQRASIADDKHGYLSLNASFHQLILTATNHRPLRQFQGLVQITSQAVYLRLGHQPLRHQKSGREHAEILAAIRERDPARAEQLARLHIRNAAEFWLKGRPEKAVSLKNGGIRKREKAISKTGRI
jgi:DNA-binding GntR family transcriptional regulator